VSGARERVHETVKVGMVDSALRLKTSRSVVVEVEIVPAPVERTVHNVPIHLKNLAPNLTAQSSPSTVDVNVRGSREGMNRVQVDDVSAFVDLSGLGAGPYTLQVRAGAAREAGVTRIEPAVVQVRIANGKD
jgi:YbbR domain-containing protein